MDCSLPGFSIHGIFSGKSTRVGCHFFLQGIFPTQGLNPSLLHCRQILYYLRHQGSPKSYWGKKMNPQGIQFYWKEITCRIEHLTFSLSLCILPHTRIQEKNNFIYHKDYKGGSSSYPPATYSSSPFMTPWKGEARFFWLHALTLSSTFFPHANFLLLSSLLSPSS